ncbi:uncharacterized protein AB675_7965 [Cyphellophora attinorum]|uniref:Uncharacterized protein n=1 Tax=Cyphellophora attinorum TaxID=1664694 RepID=A0A0N1HAX4_9EURO|nr:uncharacterized protein AB675_7965 [Phialophora attinorum]KPI41095.1 hypothetical protein AB675_7965 [Phialophora attinorum]
MPRKAVPTRSGGLRASAKSKPKKSVEQDSGYGSAPSSREASVESEPVQHGTYGGAPIRKFSKLGTVDASHDLTTHEKLCEPENDWIHKDWRNPDDEDDDWEECDDDINETWKHKTGPQGPYPDKKYYNAIWWRLSRKRRVYIVKKLHKVEIEFREYYQTDAEKPKWYPSGIGWAMSIPQFCEFVKMVPQMTAFLEALVKNLKVPRVDYSTESVELAEKYVNDPRPPTKALKPFREKTKGHKRHLEYGNDEIQPTLPYVTYSLHKQDAYEAQAEAVEKINEARMWNTISAKEMEDALKKIADEPSKIDSGPINMGNLTAQYHTGNLLTDRYESHGHDLYINLDKDSESQSTESKDSDVDMNDADSEHDSAANKE